MKMDAKQLKDELAGGRVTVVDVRTPAEFGEIHIEGSELMPLDRLQPDRVKGRSCVLVCRSGKRAMQAMEQLQAAGCEGLRVLEGGVMAWEQAGLPVKRGKSVLSLERQVRIAAGLLVLTGVVLGTWVHPAFYGLAAFVGAGLTFAGITDWCGMAMLLAKAPWNQRSGQVGQGHSCSV
ncbi:rhodanese-related sulfurtransferase [Haloferula luteola]|uniref:Rhodanese-related sulfurtransferase n=1 Tax=Haloferula luteola TaxID=595692 RepID=A0A840V991_9BACT|nr:rhodanese-like domain-containing protein [Haloferula luteola]MBB5353636.1 rhodanese-related sulfurtransferase [Haloferula luteola]